MAEYLNYSKLQKELFARTEKYAAKIRCIYREYLDKIISIVQDTELKEDSPFSFSEYGYSDEVTPIFRELYAKVYKTIRKSSESEWLLAEENNDKLIQSIFGAKAVKDTHFASLFLRNKEAMDSFLNRRENGLKLSERVWNNTKLLHTELEDSLDLALGEGTAANKLATQIKKYLNNPDMFYRRFRVKVGEDEHGNNIYGRIWKRKVFDEETGLYMWINADPKKYRPGTGVYRSSYRNAQRLARTETNIAYRTADYERWQKEDFITGIEIKLSNNHPVTDICDNLKGIYPKNFKWTGWHPQCRCYMIPILAKDEELKQMAEKILDGESTTDASGTIKDLPDNFSLWLNNNIKRYNEAELRGTLPYFLKDNIKRSANGNLVPLWHNGLLEKAQQRHQARTEAQKTAIISKWYERKAQIKFANTVKNYMSGISDVDLSPLENALNSGNYAKAEYEAKKLIETAKTIKALQYIENPIQAVKDFSMQEIFEANKAIENKINKWNQLPLDVQKKKITFEIDFVENPQIYKAGATKYPTWEIAQKAYKKQLEKVNNLLLWQPIDKDIAVLESFKTKSSIFKKLLSKIQFARQNNDINECRKLIVQAENKKKALIKTKQGKGITFNNSDFTKQRKENALWFDQTEKDKADKEFRSKTKKVWDSATKEEKIAATRYTGGSGMFNRPLRGFDNSWYDYVGIGKVSLNNELAEKDIINLTNLINKNKSNKDLWLQRGISTKAGTSNFLGLGIDASKLKAMSETELQSLVGKIVKDEAFVSCGTTKGSGFGGDILNIYCPKGTKMIYAEPFSVYNGDSLNPSNLWDGVSKYILRDEFETILQRGTSFRITKIEKVNNYLYIDVEVVAQI